MSMTHAEAPMASVKAFEEMTESPMPSNAQTGESEAGEYKSALTHLGTEPQKDDSPLPVERASITAGEQPAAVFQPDALLVAQFFEDRRHKTTLGPERKLMLAVLEDALCSFQKIAGRGTGKGNSFSMM